jgi:hypothetical protein
MRGGMAQTEPMLIPAVWPNIHCIGVECQSNSAAGTARAQFSHTAIRRRPAQRVGACRQTNRLFGRLLPDPPRQLQNRVSRPLPELPTNTCNSSPPMKTACGPTPQTRSSSMPREDFIVPDK